MVVVRYVKARSLLSPTRLGADFVINPYIGCPHGCLYCYAACMRGAAERGEPWGSYLDVKRPAAQPDLAKLYRRSILLSSMTDAYNPYEERAGVTRAILRSLVPARPDVTVITKSALVARDADIFKEFPRVKVVFSFSSLDDDFRRRAEPHASSPAKKLAAMVALKDADIPRNHRLRENHRSLRAVRIVDDLRHAEPARGQPGKNPELRQKSAPQPRAALPPHIQRRRPHLLARAESSHRRRVPLARPPVFRMLLKL